MASILFRTRDKHRRKLLDTQKILNEEFPIQLNAAALDDELDQDQYRNLSIKIKIHEIPKDFAYKSHIPADNMLIQGEGVNFLEVANEYKSNGNFVPDKETITNLGSMLSRKTSDIEIFFNDKRYFLLAFCAVLGVFKFLCLLVAANFLFYEADNFLNCIGLKDDRSGCSTDDMTNAFVVILFVAKAIACCVQIYDLTQAGTMLMGNQTFAARAKFSWFLPQINFRGRVGLFLWRGLLLLFILVSSYYGKDGSMAEPFDFADILTYPLEMFDAPDIAGALDVLVSPKMLLYYILVLLVLSLLKLIFAHPWVSAMAPNEADLKEANSRRGYGELSKTATAILTANTVVFCLFVALTLKNIFDLITRDANDNYSFDSEAAQIYFLLIAMMFFVAFKYVRAALTMRSSDKVAVFFLFYTPFVLFFLGFCGLQVDDEIVRYVLIISSLGTIAINFAYYQLAFLLPSLKNEIGFSLKFLTNRYRQALLLSLAVCVFIAISFTSGLKSAEENWFEFDLNFCSGFAGQNGLALLQKIGHQSSAEVYSNIQDIFLLIPVVTVLFGGAYVVFDHKSRGFRKEQFWVCALAIVLNITNIAGLSFLQSMLDNLRNSGMVVIDFLEEGFDLIENAGVFAIVAAALQMACCLVSPAGVNISYKPTRNPSFRGKVCPKAKNTVESNVSELCRTTELLRGNDPKKNLLSIFSTIAILAVYVIFSVSMFVEANSRTWISIDPNEHSDYTGAHDVEGGSGACEKGYASLAAEISGLRTSLAAVAEQTVEWEDLVDDRAKVLMTVGVPISAVLSSCAFAAYVFDAGLIQPYVATFATNVVVWPAVPYVVFAPVIVDSAVLSLSMSLGVGAGLYYAFGLFFGNLVAMALLSLEGLPIASLRATKADLELARVKESLEY